MALDRGMLATMDEYADAYCAKDIGRLMALFDEGEDISVIGTGQDELCSGREQIQDLFLRNFSEATASRFEWHWRQTTLRGDTGLVSASLTIHLRVDGKPLQVPLRWTVVARRDGDRWLWLHRHASSAAASQEEGGAYPVE